MLNVILVFTSAIKRIDSFGPSINFRIKKEENYKTVIGGLFSLVSFVLFFYFFVIFGTDYFFKINPILLLKSESDDYKNFTLQAENFLFAFRIIDDKANYYDYSDYFYIDASIYSKHDSPMKLNLSSCDHLISNKSSPFYNDMTDSDGFNCISLPYEKNKNFSIGGYYQSEYQRNILFDINPKLINKNEIQEFQKSSFYQKFKKNKIFLEYYVPESFFDVTNYTHPLKYNFVPYYTLLSNKMSRSDDIFYGKSIFYADYGSIFEDVEIFENIGYFKSTVFLGFYEENSFETDFYDDGLIYYSILIFFDKKENMLFRRYIKIQELFGYIFGFMQLLTILMEFVFSYLVNFDLSKYLSNTFTYMIRNNKYHENLVNLENLEIKKNFKDIQSDLYKLNRNFSFVKTSEIKKNNSYIDINLENLTNQNKNDDKIFLSFNKVNFRKKTNLIDSIIKIDNIDQCDDSLSQNNLEINKLNNGELKKKKFSKETKNNHSKKKINSYENNLSLRTNVSLFKKEKLFEKNQLNSLFEINKKKKIFNYNIFQFYLKCFNLNKNQYDKNITNIQFSDKINELLYEKLDISNYFHLSNELKLIQNLLFNEKQKSIINYLSEKSIYLNFFMKHRILRLNEFSEENQSDASDILQNVENIRQDKSSLNEKFHEIIKGLL